MAGEETGNASDVEVDAEGGGGDAGSESAGAPVEAAATGDKPGETKAEAAARRKVRRFGKDQELDADTAFKMLDDDYEHEFPGAGGKPLGTKYNWHGIQRAVQLHTGALDAMQKHNEARKNIEGVFEFAKQKPEHVQSLLENQLGVEDFEQWVFERAKEAYLRQQELTELSTSNPLEYHRRVEASARGKFERKQAQEKALADRAAREKQRVDASAETERKVNDAFKAAGLPTTRRVHAIADEIVQRYREAGALEQLDYQQLALLTKEAYHADIHGHMDGLDDEGLIKFLGDKRRERIRAAEVVALKGKKKEDAAQKRGAEQPAASSNGANKRPAGEVSDRDFAKQFRLSRS